MTPAQFPKTQEEANALSAKLQDFWRQTSIDYMTMLGPEIIAEEDRIVALNFEKARNSIEDVAKKLKQEQNLKRGKNDSN